MIKTVLDHSASRSCTGCGLCSAVCPTSAITMWINPQGFRTPEINEKSCVNCGLCQQACYRFEFQSPVPAGSPLACYSAVNRNSEELRLASSGGVSSELMRQCLKNGYHVVGVCYNAIQSCAVSKIATAEAELDQFRGSKYFQSDTEAAFKHIIHDTTDQKYALFGTPCHIYAFDKYAKKHRCRDRFLLVDIFCHGCPSLTLWHKYLQHIQKKTGISDFDEIRFRSKTHGWHEYCFDFIKGTKQYTSSKRDDPFFSLFFGMNCMNLACYDCVPRSSLEWCDIRLGDFWGKRFDENTSGVSAVIIQTERGKHCFEEVQRKFDIQEVLFTDVIAAQSYGKTHIVNHNHRVALLESLASDKEIQTIVREELQTIPLCKKVRLLCKRIAHYLPQKYYLKLKKWFH